MGTTVLYCGSGKGEPVYSMVKIKAAVFLFYKTLLNLFWNFFDGSKFSSPSAAKRRHLNQFAAAVVNPAAVLLRHKFLKVRKRQQAKDQRRCEEETEDDRGDEYGLLRLRLAMTKISRLAMAKQS